jgi:hypothetical protein
MSRNQLDRRCTGSYHQPTHIDQIGAGRCPECERWVCLLVSGALRAHSHPWKRRNMPRNLDPLEGWRLISNGLVTP